MPSTVDDAGDDEDDIQHAAVPLAPFHVDVLIDDGKVHNLADSDEDEDAAGSPMLCASSAAEFQFGGLSSGNQTASFKATLTALTILSLVIHLPSSLVGPFLPNEAKKHSSSIGYVGIIFSSFFVGVFVSAHFWGKCISQVGCRPLIMGGTVLMGIFTAMFAYIDAFDGGTFIAVAVLIRLLQGISCSATETGATAFLAGEYPEEVCRVSTYMEMSECVGFMFGPLLGGLLYDWGGFRLPFIVIGAILVAAMLLLNWLLPKVTKIRLAHTSVTLSKVLWSPGVPITVMSALCGMSVFAFLDPILEPHFERHNLSPSIIGLLFMLQSFAYIVCAPVVTSFMKPGNTTAFLIIGLLVSALSLCLLGPIPIGLIPDTMSMQCLALALVSAGCSLMLVPTVPRMVLFTHHLGHGASDVVAGLVTASFSLGEIVGPMISGLFLEFFSFDLSVCIFSMLLIASWFSVYLLDQSRCRSRTEGDDCDEPLLYGDLSSSDLQRSSSGLA